MTSDVTRRLLRDNHARVIRDVAKQQANRGIDTHLLRPRQTTHLFMCEWVEVSVSVGVYLYECFCVSVCVSVSELRDN